MPRRAHVTLPGFYSAFDLSPWAGSYLCQRMQLGAPEIEVPTLASGELGDPDSEDAGEYLDAIEALCGHGSAAADTLSGRLTATWASLLGAGVIGATLDTNDRLKITNGGVQDLIFHPAPGNAAWGVPAAGVTVPGGESVTMTGEWQRGITDPNETLIIKRDGVPDQVPVTVHRCQDRRIALRQRGALSDLDDRSRWCLEDGDADTRWGVTSTGHAWWGTTDTSDVLEGMEWLSSSFRDRLGFTGDEALTTWGVGAGLTVTGQIATHPLPGVCHPSRPLRRQSRTVEIAGSTLRLVSGAFAGVHIGSYRGWRIEAWIDGPMDLGADLHAHWLEMLSDAALCAPGRPITVYQDVGDSRRALDPRRVNADQPAYSLLHTSEAGPYRGRLLCRVADVSRELAMEQEGNYRRRFPVELFVEDREAGI